MTMKDMAVVLTTGTEEEDTEGTTITAIMEEITTKCQAALICLFRRIRKRLPKNRAHIANFAYTCSSTTCYVILRNLPDSPVDLLI